MEIKFYVLKTVSFSFYVFDHPHTATRFLFSSLFDKKEKKRKQNKDLLLQQ